MLPHRAVQLYCDLSATILAGQVISRARYTPATVDRITCAPAQLTSDLAAPGDRLEPVLDDCPVTPHDFRLTALRP